MFTVRVKERGGEERQQTFDHEEVSVGRGKTNDVVLPRGNVSKRHARIVRRGDKFFVVDLRSTNGTYFNGRKITAPVIVTPDDKIYVGDFVLRLDLSAEIAASTPPPIPNASATGDTDAAVHPPLAAFGERQSAQPPQRPEEEDPFASALLTHEDEPTKGFDAASIQAGPAPDSAPRSLEAGLVEELEVSLEFTDNLSRAADAVDAGDDDETAEREFVSDLAPSIPVAAAEPPGALIVESERPEDHVRPASTRPSAVVIPTLQGISGIAQRVIDLVLTSSEAGTAYVREDTPKLRGLFATCITEALGEGAEADVDDPAQLAADLASTPLLALLLANPDIDMVTAMEWDRVFVRRGGQVERWSPGYPSPETFAVDQRRLRAALGDDAAAGRGGLHGRLPGGVAVRLVSGLGGAGMGLWQLRRSADPVPPLRSLVEAHVLEESAAHELAAFVREGRNILVVGPPGRGTATVLSALGLFLSDDSLIGIVDLSGQVELPQDGAQHFCPHTTDRGLEGVLENLSGLELNTLVVGGLTSGAVVPFLIRAPEVAPQVLGSAVGRDLAGFLQRAMTLCGGALGVTAGDAGLADLVSETLDVLVQVENSDGGLFEVTRLAHLRRGDEGTLRVEDIQFD